MNDGKNYYRWYNGKTFEKKEDEINYRTKFLAKFVNKAEEDHKKSVSNFRDDSARATKISR